VFKAGDEVRVVTSDWICKMVSYCSLADDLSSGSFLSILVGRTGVVVGKNEVLDGYDVKFGKHLVYIELDWAEKTLILSTATPA
jgi:hypothetical protein